MSAGRLLAGTVLAAAMTVAVGSIGVAVGPDRSIEIDVRWSRFSPALARVPAGVPVRIVLVNHDPIDHEWIVGDAATHAAHRTGTEASHGSRATEVSVPAGGRVETVVTFTRPGSLAFICHLPGHEEYGMTGTLVVARSAAGT